MPLPVTVHGFNRLDMRPDLTIKGTGIHRQCAAQGAGNPGQKFDTDPAGPGAHARQLAASHAASGVQGAVIQPFDRRQGPEGMDHRPRETAVTDQQIAAQPQPQQRFVFIQILQEQTQLIDTGRLIETPRPATGTP